MASSFKPVVGGVKGTAALITINEVGFKPSKVEVYDQTAGGVFHHIASMDADTAHTGTGTVIAVDGITLTDLGFTIGVDAALNPAGNDLRWIAYP